MKPTRPQVLGTLLLGIFVFLFILARARHLLIR
jgi:hypothetical protein